MQLLFSLSEYLLNQLFCKYWFLHSPTVSTEWVRLVYEDLNTGDKLKSLSMDEMGDGSIDFKVEERPSQCHNCIHKQVFEPGDQAMCKLLWSCGQPFFRSRGWWGEHFYHWCLIRKIVNPCWQSSWLLVTNSFFLFVCFLVDGAMVIQSSPLTCNNFEEHFLYSQRCHGLQI